MLIDSLEKVIPWMFPLDNTSDSLWLTIYLKPLKEYNPANIRLGEDVLRTSSRRLQEVLEDEKCYAEDVVENKKCLLGMNPYYCLLKNDNFSIKKSND